MKKGNLVQERKERLLSSFSKTKMKTVNEVIEGLFRSDIKNGLAKGRGWRYYVHLNKLPSPLEKEGKLEQVGVNENGEKIMDKTLNYIQGE